LEELHSVKLAVASHRLQINPHLARLPHRPLVLQLLRHKRRVSQLALDFLSSIKIQALARLGSSLFRLHKPPNLQWGRRALPLASHLLVSLRALVGVNRRLVSHLVKLHLVSNLLVNHLVSLHLANHLLGNLLVNLRLDSLLLANLHSVRPLDLVNLL
jgi:hypothetical protein